MRIYKVPTVLCAAVSILLLASCSDDAAVADPATALPEDSTPPVESRAEGGVDAGATESSLQSGDSELPAAITCFTQYRPVAGSLADAEGPSLRVDREDGLVAIGRSVEFESMTLRVRYLGEGPEGRNVNIDVSTDDGDPLARVLFQLGRVAIDEVRFSGGHGFTGLHSVFHDGAWLQFSCTAGRA